MSQQSNPATLREQEHRYDSGIYRDCSCGWLAPITSWKTSTDLRKLQAVHAALAASGTEAAPEPDTSDIPEVKDWSNAVVGKFYRPNSAQAAASPEGEGREADDVHALFEKWWDFAEATLAVDLKGMARDAFCAGWACGEAPLRQSAAPSGGCETHNELEIVKRVLAWHQTGYALFHNTEGHGVHESHNMAIGWASVELAKWLAQESKTGAVTETK